MSTLDLVDKAIPTFAWRLRRPGGRITSEDLVTHIPDLAIPRRSTVLFDTQAQVDKESFGVWGERYLEGKMNLLRSLLADVWGLKPEVRPAVVRSVHELLTGSPEPKHTPPAGVGGPTLSNSSFAARRAHRDPVEKLKHF